MVGETIQENIVKENILWGYNICSLDPWWVFKQTCLMTDPQHVEKVCSH
jgi:hypothetical protein